MKTLLLLRHAKSSRDDPALDDFERPLTSRGQDAALRMGRYLRDKVGKPDLVLCSAAVRTRQTLDRIIEAFGSGIEMRALKGLYLAEPNRLLAAVRRAPDDVRRLLLVGHNPGLGTLATQLCARGDAALLRRMAEKFPTGALAEIRFDIEHWADAAPEHGRLRDFVVPRDLKS